MTATNRAGLQQAIERLEEAKKICWKEDAETEEVANALNNAEYDIDSAIAKIAWVRIHRMQPSLGMNIVKPHERSQP